MPCATASCFNGSHDPRFASRWSLLWKWLCAVYSNNGFLRLIDLGQCCPTFSVPRAAHGLILRPRAAIISTDTNLVNIISYVDVSLMQGRSYPYPLRLRSIPLGTMHISPNDDSPHHWSTVDNAQRSNYCRHFRRDFTIDFLNETLKMHDSVCTACQ